MVATNNFTFELPAASNGSFCSYSSGYSETSNASMGVARLPSDMMGYQFPQPQQDVSASSPPVQMLAEQPISYSYSTQVEHGTSPPIDYHQPVYSVPSISPIPNNYYQYDASSCSSYPSAPSSVREVSEIYSEESIEPQTSMGSYIVLVQFKWGRQGEFQNDGSLALGTHVIVSADRGRDLGMVVESRISGKSDRENKLMQKVVRVAKAGEIAKWRTNISNEEKAAKRTCQKVMAKVGIVMKVMHAEYQFDMKKVTFHFSSQTSHPDFRPVLDSLYSIFRCRIWFARYSNTDLDKANKKILTGADTESDEIEEELSDIELPLMTKKKSKKNKKKANKRKTTSSTSL